MKFEEHKNQMCLRKKVYRKKRLAIIALEEIKTKRVVSKNFKVYKCHYCLKFHLGHNKELILDT